MKKRFLFVLTLAAVGLGLLTLWSCGDLDPAKAPAGAQITIVQGGETVTVNYTINKEFSLPDICTELITNRLIQICIADQSNDTPTVACGILDPQTCCDAGGGWDKLPDDVKANESFKQQAAGCGNREIILTAVVFAGSDSGDAASSTTSSTSFGEVFNDIEVRWTTIGQDVSLYELADVPGTIAPLGELYIDRTNDRGISEIKATWPLPVTPGSKVSYGVRADIGYDGDVYQEEYTVDETTDTATDDDATDDDAGA